MSEERVEGAHPGSDSLPDIYVLLMDGYANSHNLEKYWHFSNDQLLNTLRAKGFHVVDSSKSNYFYTVHTVSSMLNMHYHPEAKQIDDNKFLRDISDNTSVKVLAKNGYKIINYSLFDFTGYPSAYRLNVFPGSTSLIDYYLRQTVYYFVLEFQTDHSSFSNRRKNIAADLIKLTKTNTNQPKFVYAHFFVTHPPFYLDSLGRVDEKLWATGHHSRAETASLLNNVSTDDTLVNRKNEQAMLDGYLNHIKEGNRIVLSLVQTILTNSKRPPVILLMSDHGYRFLTGILHQEMVDERYGNLCAFYFPDRNYRMIEKTITPVNYMRLILSKALNRPYQPLADKSHLKIN